MLRTKAMREKEEQREKRKYRYTLIRIRFPDGFVLQVSKLSEFPSIVLFFIFHFSFRLGHFLGL